MKTSVPERRADPSQRPELRVFATLNHLLDEQQPSGSWLRAMPDAVERFAEVAEGAGCEGVLIFTGNTSPHAWVMAQLLMERSQNLTPLVAVRPDYAHPFDVFSRVSAIHGLFGRKICLNLVVGANPCELDALGAESLHDERYSRLLEYAKVLRALGSGVSPHSFRGSYYNIHELRVAPELDPEASPEMFVAGSSPAARRIATSLGATWIHSPSGGFDEALRLPGAIGHALSVGLIARATHEEAWREANRIFPFLAADDGEAATPSASESHWRLELTRAAEETEGRRSVCWLAPFALHRHHHRGRRSNHPWLVGSHETIADYLRPWIAGGVNTLIVYVEQSRDLLELAAIEKYL